MTVSIYLKTNTLYLVLFSSVTKQACSNKISSKQQTWTLTSGLNLILLGSVHWAGDHMSYRGLKEPDKAKITLVWQMWITPTTAIFHNQKAKHHLHRLFRFRKFCKITSQPRWYSKPQSLVREASALSIRPLGLYYQIIIFYNIN